MRWRPLIWLALGLLVLAVVWRLSPISAVRHALPHQSVDVPPQAKHSGVGFVREGPATKTDPRFPYRLSNTSKPLQELARSDKAVLLENALLDTERPLDLPIPQSFRSLNDPGSYIVQSRAAAGSRFRALLEAAGAKVVAYIPNNAYLVRAPAPAVEVLSVDAQVQAVIPYEPYYKLRPALLGLALSSLGTGAGAGSAPSDVRDLLSLHVLLFPDASEASRSAVAALAAEVSAPRESPFGAELEVRVSAKALAPLALLPEVQEMELSSPRVTANDLTRATLGVAANSTVPVNYLGLTGTNVLVNVNDTGVDANYPGLASRVFSDTPGGVLDTNGHGTHVAGVIAGNGLQSRTATNAPGSALPPVDGQFRGQAPGASIFAIAVDLASGGSSDAYLQQTAALANGFISNNSWHYAGRNEYDLAAASYDAAVRDALPGVSGSQPLLYVFAAGNTGGGAGDGTGGTPDTVASPATAKNVITVGAVEQSRQITNETWSCGSGPCQTNTPWLGMTDSGSEVAAFSARGNVGIGIEGSFGRFKPDVVAPGTFVVSAKSTQWDQATYYARSNNAVVPFPDANYFPVLSNLNNGLGPFYRFESGTSLAAASVSGTLALMQEFFQQRLAQTNSPALMKALLINGARVWTNLYGLSVRGTTNAQGWGLVQLPNSLPAALTNIGASSRPMFLFDQNPAQALATGQSHSRFVSVSAGARNQPLRVTLVWTDPPANPVVGIKLVNDLDLIVTNLDNGQVFLGNDIAPGASFNSPSDPATFASRDFVNNVENVYLAPGLGANYSVTILGRRVNVNAVPEQANDIVQDYALVISSGDGLDTDALTLNNSPTVFAGAASVTWITNGFDPRSENFGNLLIGQRAGANGPLAATNTISLSVPPGAMLTTGELSQWHFYVFTNTPAFTNVAFLTFVPNQISFSSAQPGAQLPEADIDLYVSTNQALTNLDPVALAKADASVGRTGDEIIIYSNAVPAVFYIGVKSESQQAADYGFVAISSESPFAQIDSMGNELLRGFSVPAVIPGPQGGLPGASWLFAICPDSFPIHRVIVTNTLTCASLPGLQSTLMHLDESVVLNNHSGTGLVDHAVFVYDDSDQDDVTGAQASDGPGSLLDFAANDAFGQWRLAFVNTNQPGTDNDLWIFVERQQDLGGSVSVSILPSACREDFINLPPATTNLSALVTFASGTGPLSMEVCRSDDPLGGCLVVPMTSPGTNGAIILDSTSHPPLNPGTYFLRLCNLGPDPASANITVMTSQDVTPPSLTTFTSSPGMPILDDATSSASLPVTNTDRILSVEVGVRIDHPRVSDLALRLVSPQGTKVLLDENRGGTSTAGLGTSEIVTSTVPISYAGGPEAVTNTVDTGQTSGIIGINYDFYALPDDMRVYYDGQLLYDSGLVSFNGSTNLAYGPGLSTSFTIVMNEGGNANSNTSWFYSVTSTRKLPVYFTFTEETNVASLPIKFAPTPFTNLNYFGTGTRPGNGIFYLPEESLDKFVGESALGAWRLEIEDTRSGATSPPPTLVTWQLAFRFRDIVPTPIALSPEQLLTNMLGPGQVQWFSVDVPTWVSFVTNSLLSSSAPVNLWFNPAVPPTGTNAGDSTLLSNVTAGTAVLATNRLPSLIPGARCYLGVQNTNGVAVRFVLELDFDIDNVITLQSGVPYSNNNPGPAGANDYYRYVVTTNAVRAQFEINGPTSDVTLLARGGPPPPTAASYDYLSANPGTNDELIVVYNDSRPVSLSPGEWFLTVVNASGIPAGYSIMATEFSDYGTNIMITSSNASSNSFCLTWNSLPGIHYFVQGKRTVTDTNWTTLSATLTATDVTTGYCLPLPIAFEFFRVEEGLVVLPPPLFIADVNYGSSGVLLQWLAATNHQFRVEWTTSLESPHWAPFTNVITSPNELFSFLDDGSQSGGILRTRFYRLQQLP